jgi:acid stress-induced BolA-like protein IbaG/YrbA
VTAGDGIERDVESRIGAAIAGARVTARGDDHRMEIRVVADVFAGLSRVKKQQLVYAAIAELIAGNRLHAVSIQALTPVEAGDGPADRS